MTFNRHIGIIALLLPAACALPHPGQPPALRLTDKVHAILDTPALKGTRWGLLVTDMDGRDILAINPDGRFMPASNTKIFTTAAAVALLPGMDEPDRTSGASVRILHQPEGAPDVELAGGGDARLSDRADCGADCLQALADAVAATGVRRVRDIIGDDTLFPDERWGPGWSWNNLQTRSGTAVSALTLDDNVAALTVSPGSSVGAPASAVWNDGEAYLELRNEAVTVAEGKTDLMIERQPGTRLVRLYGTIATGSAPNLVGVGIDDPADFAAFHFRRLLEARGIRVTGDSHPRHRPLAPEDNAGATPPPRTLSAPVLAQLTPPPLADDVRYLLKVSQNLHAELLLRRMGLLHGAGSIAQGGTERDHLLAAAGVPHEGVELSDGSGMSSYNRVSPRAAATLLRWASGQPWGATWRAGFPVAGQDGTLSHRFQRTALAGKLFAKTGTLNATHALSGYMVGASGQTLIFSCFANDEPSDAPGVTAAMDAALLAVAAAD